MKTIPCLAAILLSFTTLTGYAAPAANIKQPLSAKEVYAKVANSIYAIYVDDNDTKEPELRGGAVAISKDLLATNCHVIEDAKHFYIETNGKKLQGKLYSADETKDVCLVYSQGAVYAPVVMRLSREVDIGEDVYAIGNPEALEKSISKGIISNKHEGSMVLLQTDAAVAPGSSGGGLFDEHGELIGLTAAKEGDGIGFVVPTEVIVAQILNPKIPVKANPPEATTNVIKELGVYGENKVGLYLDNNICFIALLGNNEKNKKTIAAIWLPDNPDVILFFPSASDVEQAMNIAININFTKDTIFPTKEKMLLSNERVNLVSTTETGPYETLAAVLDNNPMEALNTNNDLTLKLSDKSAPSGYQDIRFGLNGFKEAISAYRSNCH